MHGKTMLVHSLAAFFSRYRRKNSDSDCSRGKLSEVSSVPEPLANQCGVHWLHRSQLDEESSVATRRCACGTFSDPIPPELTELIPIFQPYVTISPSFPGSLLRVEDILKSESKYPSDCAGVTLGHHRVEYDPPTDRMAPDTTSTGTFRTPSWHKW
jgi:hypothetical protein